MVTVKDRAEKSTTLIANTAEMAAMRIMCGAVIRDFNTNGVMFRGIDRNRFNTTIANGGIQRKLHLRSGYPNDILSAA